MRKKNFWCNKAAFNNKEELDMLNNDVRVNKWLSIEYRDGLQSGKCTITKDGSVLECPVILDYNNLYNASSHFLSSHRSQLQQACRLPEVPSKKKPRTDEGGIAQLFNRYNNNNNSININNINNNTSNNGDNFINSANAPMNENIVFDSTSFSLKVISTT